MIVKVGKNLAFEMPSFIHEFGYEGHHGSLMRTCPRDEDGDYDLKAWKNPVRNWQIDLHEIIEETVCYPLRHFLIENEGRSIKKLDIALGFLWGLLCAFPFKDVILYTAWCIHGCPAIKVRGLKE